MEIASTFGYARPADGAYIGYRIDGDGPVDIVQQPEWPGNIDAEWESAFWASWIGGLAKMGRVITHDHRGVGLSSRNVGLPNLETRVSDLMCVLDAVAVERPVMVGFLSSGGVNALAAATHPDLARALVWCEPDARYAWAPDYPWGNRWEQLDDELAAIADWGTERYGRWSIEVEEADNPQPEFSPEVAARQSRNACTPDVARELSRIWYETDVRGILPSVRTPALLLVHEGRPTSVARAEHIAGLMPSAEVRVMPGTAWTVQEHAAWLGEIRRFVGEALPQPPSDTVLATVLFTDIVDSTSVQARIGDRAWRDLIEQHHATVRRLLDRFGGREQDTAGDGFFARFDGPARAIKCAQEIASDVRRLGIEIRAGVHTGECEIADGKCAGLSVTIGARVMAHARPSQVLVSQTVKDLVAGSGLAFDDADERDLKGVPGRWHLYRVVQ